MSFIFVLPISQNLGQVNYRYLFSSLQFILKPGLIFLHLDFGILKLLKLDLNRFKLLQLQFIVSPLGLQLQ